MKSRHSVFEIADVKIAFLVNRWRNLINRNIVITVSVSITGISQTSSEIASKGISW